MSKDKKSLRKELERAWTQASEDEYQKQRLSEHEATERGSKLMKQVQDSSSESSRIFQTLNHLGGKKAGEAAEAATRHMENVKESMAEDEFRNAELARKRKNAVSSEPLLIDRPPSKKRGK